MRWATRCPKACARWRRSWAGRASCPAGRSTPRWRPPRSPPPARRRPATRRGCEARPGRILGLYSGGSLAHEACVVLDAAGRARRPPSPRPSPATATWSSTSATERYTQGRPHPMVDLGIRLELLEAAAGDGRTACVLLDVVCGHGAHADPASELAGAVAAPPPARRSWPACAGPTPTPRTPGARPRRCARRARSSRPPTRPPRGWRRGRSREDRDADLLGAPARRASCTRSRSAGALAAPRARGRAVRDRPAGPGFFRTPPVPAHVVAPRRRPTRPSTSASARSSTPTPRACARRCATAATTSSTPRTASRPTPRSTLRDEGVVDAVDAHRPPRRRLPLALADRLPAALDRRPRPRARGLDAVDRAAARRVRRRRRARPQRRRRRPLPPAARRRRARRRARRGRPRRRAGHPHGRRHRAAQGIADAAARLRRRPRGLPERRPCCSWPAARRCSTTATRSTASTRCASDLGPRRLGARARPGHRRELEGLYRAADVFALPSVKEGFGLAVLEALAAGLPAVVSDLDVFQTYLADGDSALMAPVGDTARSPPRWCARPPPGPRRAAARRRARGGGAPRLGRRRGGPRGGLLALPGRGEPLMALGGGGHLARRLRHRRAGARATRSGSTSPPRRAATDTRHDADRAVLRRAGELLLPGGGLRGGQARPGGARA